MICNSSKKRGAGLCILVAFLVTYVQMAGAQREASPIVWELEPVESALTYHTPEYHIRMRRVFSQSSTGTMTSEFQLLLLPSFESETLLTVGKHGEEFIAQVLRPDKQIWTYEGDDATLEVSRKEKKLATPLAERAGSLWRTMLLRTKYQRRRLALDGTSYVFLSHAPDYPPLVGALSSSDWGRRPYLLAQIGECLIAYVEEGQEKEETLLSRLADLMKQLESAIEKGHPAGDEAGDEAEDSSDKAGKDRYPNIDEVIERLSSSK